MTTNAQRHDDWTPSELSRFAIDAEYAALLRETVGGNLLARMGWTRALTYLPANDDPADVQATLNWLVARHEAVGRDIERVRDHLAGLQADLAAAYDAECEAR